MMCLHDNLARFFSKPTLCVLIFLVLLLSSIANASSDVTSICKNMSANVIGEMTGESMSQTGSSNEDCCEVDVLPDCCKTCNGTVLSFPSDIMFILDKPQPINIAGVTHRLSSISLAPLLRPPSIS